MLVVHPWRDLRRYVEVRLEEAEAELKLAERFLEEGLYRNAAGKAFQAWKSLMAAVAALHRDALAQRFPGVVKTREGRTVARVDWIVAYMPTSRLREVAVWLRDAAGFDAVPLTDLALNLHEFQYNGVDKEAVLSRYTTLDAAVSDLKYFLERCREVLRDVAGRLSQAGSG